MRVALILSGGGAKGCFQVGVIKSLIDSGITPSIIYGTSTGSLQAAGYSHLGIKRLEQVWLSIKDKSDIFRWNWRNLFRDGKYDMVPLAKKLQAINDETRECGVSCEAIVTRVCLEDGSIEYIPYDHPEFTQSVLASSSVPFVARPVEINGKHYVDGGVRDQVPIKDVKKLLADGYKVIVISCNPMRINPFDQWKWPKFFQLWGIIYRVSDDILPCETWLDELRQIQELQEQGKDIQIYLPDHLWMDTEEYDPVKIRQGIAMGEASKPTNLVGVQL